jgi:hypothetical protein
MTSRVILSLMVFAVFCGQAAGQGQADLDNLAEKLTKHFEKVLPGWTHKRGEPIVKTEKVLIQFWYAPNRSVKIAVSPRSSGNEARDAVQEFISYERTEALRDFGDEAYSWGYGAANIVFRKGRLVFFVSSRADVDADADARTLSREQRFEKEKSERRRLSLEFAKHAVNAVDSP